MEIVKHVELRDVKDIYEQLVLNYNNWRGYIYRGHGDSKYQLLPTLLRDTKNYKTKADLFIYELSLLLKFYRVCNNQGLHVPEIKMFRDTYLTDCFDFSYLITEKSGFYWLPDDAFELAALSQHYGIETRFLDWTQDVQIALYFAANGNYHSDSKIDSFSIWAINAEWLQEFKKFQLKDIGMLSRTLSKNEKICVDETWINEAYDNSLPLRFCIPHYALNPNLCAQKGVLTVWQYNIISQLSNPMSLTLFTDLKHFNNLVSNKIHSFMNESPKEAPLDAALEKYFNSPDTEECVNNFLNYNPLLDKNILYHFVIPSSCADDLIGILKHQHYGIAKLFPGYKGAAETVNDELGAKS